MNSIIEDVQVRKILDSRGNPTIEVDVLTWNSSGRAAAPSGASTGSREVVSFPDGGVDTVVSEMEDFIASELIGMDAEDIETIDEVLKEIEATNVGDAIFANASVHRKLKELIQIKDSNFTGGKGDEGGWVPNITNVDALEIQVKACEEVGDELGIEIRPSLDMAASELWDANKQKYVYAQDGIERDTGDQIDFVKDIIETYNMFYVEDPFDESDFDGFAQLTAKVGKKCLICGDDLFVTNKELLAKGIEMNAANAIIIKPNQIGSLSETYATVKLAKENGIVPVVSHRSGETTDETIAHLAVGFVSPMIKTGAIGGERIAKLNELIRIEEEFPNPKMGSF